MWGGVEEESSESDGEWDHLDVNHTLLLSFGLLLLFSSIPFLSRKVLSERDRIHTLAVEKEKSFSNTVHTHYYMYLSFLVVLPFLVITLCYICSYPQINHSRVERGRSGRRWGEFRVNRSRRLHRNVQLV